MEVIALYRFPVRIEKRSALDRQAIYPVPRVLAFVLFYRCLAVRLVAFFKARPLLGYLQTERENTHREQKDRNGDQYHPPCRRALIGRGEVSGHRRRNEAAHRRRPIRDNTG